LKRFSEETYFVFPGYGAAFLDMKPWLTEWERSFSCAYRFWKGFGGGGLLSVSSCISTDEVYYVARREFHAKRVCGMVLGNEAAMEMAANILCVQED